MPSPAKTALIIGAGPAGLTAAYELLKNTDIKPVIFEATGDIGGIAKTINYKGNRIDMGGHRFFSKSEKVMRWWTDILPLQGAPSRDDLAVSRPIPLSSKDGAPDPQKTDLVMLVRSRLSRIYYLKTFFDYPISLTPATFLNLGFLRVLKIGASYAKARIFPIKKEKTLEDFMINRFGRELYLTFFKDYTKKVWGVPPSQIKADWGVQRIKGISVRRVLAHAVKSILRKDDSLAQRKTETSLIEQFMYPKLGPGQLWERVAQLIHREGGEIKLNSRVTGVLWDGNRVTGLRVKDEFTNEVANVLGDYVLSVMPVCDLVAAMGKDVPADVQQVAAGLKYRDFITVGLLLKKLKIKNTTNFLTVEGVIPDTWNYIQERDVKIGRLQIFNNWSPYLVARHGTVWVGLEYFCNEGDELWRMSDREFIDFAAAELASIGIINSGDILDSTIIRIPKTYPAYFGTYEKFNIVRNFMDRFENLFLIGRNGMHKYNNMDHSMLTAMAAVENIMNGVKTKENIWAVNTEEEYHEE